MTLLEAEGPSARIDTTNGNYTTFSFVQVWGEHEDKSLGRMKSDLQTLEAICCNHKGINMTQSADVLIAEGKMPGQRLGGRYAETRYQVGPVNVVNQIDSQVQATSTTIAVADEYLQNRNVEDLVSALTVFYGQKPTKWGNSSRRYNKNVIQAFLQLPTGQTNAYERIYTLVTGQNGRVIATYGALNNDMGMVVEVPQVIIDWLEKHHEVANVYRKNIPNDVIRAYLNASMVNGAEQWNNYVSHGFDKKLLPTPTARKTG